MLQLVEEALDQVALPIDEVIDRALDFAVAGSRDMGRATASCDKAMPKPQFASGRGVGPNMKRFSNSEHS